MEDDTSDPYEDDHGIERSDGIDKISAIYSDFNILNPATSDDGGDDWGYLDALDGIQPEDLPDMPPPPPEDANTIVEMLKEKERQGDSYFVQVRE